MKQALVIIDIQNDYFPGGNMELVGMDEAADKAEQALALFRDKALLIFHIQHLSTRPGATFLVPGTLGAEIHLQVSPEGDEPLIHKNFPSAFRETSLQQQLQDAGVEALVLCGAMTQMCIDTSVRAAFDLGFRCLLLSDACATKDMEFAGEVVPAAQVQAAFMAALSMPFAQVIATGDLESHLQ
ncbi:MAG: nicotinamidase-related amidase [Planctomycetota bacterium]|jgi:nicotinamidase-related amidase